jgi:hypothetical protein
MNSLSVRYIALALVVLILIAGGVLFAVTRNNTSALTASSTPVATVATSTVSTTTATTTVTKTPVAPIKKPVVITKTTTVTTVTKPPTTAQTITVTPTPTGPAITTTPYTVTNTVKVSPIALLAGGSARTGTLVPVSYLQVTNQTTESVTVKGFTVRQQGTAPSAAVIGFSSVDDKSGSRGSVGGTEGSGVMDGGTGYIPSTAVIGPGQMKLFTLKAQLSSSAQYIGTTLTLEVTGVDVGVPLTASLPIRGTTWTISQ